MSCHSNLKTNQSCQIYNQSKVGIFGQLALSVASVSRWSVAVKKKYDEANTLHLSAHHHSPLGLLYLLQYL